MKQNEIIELLKQSKVHVYSETFAGVEKFYVQGQLEYFENFVKLLGQSCVSICTGIEKDTDLEMDDGCVSDGALLCKEELKEYFEL
jgi:hypothetical protein